MHFCHPWFHILHLLFYFCAQRSNAVLSTATAKAVRHAKWVVRAVSIIYTSILTHVNYYSFSTALSVCSVQFPFCVFSYMPWLSRTQPPCVMRVTCVHRTWQENALSGHVSDHQPSWWWAHSQYQSPLGLWTHPTVLEWDVHRCHLLHWSKACDSSLLPAATQTWQ